MRKPIFYLHPQEIYMPLKRLITTYKHMKFQMIKALLLYFASCFLTVILLTSCGLSRWHAIEEIPAEQTAYLRDGVFVSGDYIRNATVSEIDGKTVDRDNKDRIEIMLGMRQIKVLCDEARGSFDSSDLAGESKILSFEAKVQRTYLVRCLPFSHWWIEDSENHSIVAGEKPANN